MKLTIALRGTNLFLSIAALTAVTTTCFGGPPGQRCLLNRRSSSKARAAGASSKTPARPPGQGKVANGMELKVKATCAIQPAGQDATWPMTAASGGLKSEMNAASNPSTVTGATAGIASRFAGSATQPTLVPIAISSGKVANWAAVVMATASTSAGGQRADHRCRASPFAIDGDSRIRPAVAATERAKPQETASHHRRG